MAFKVTHNLNKSVFKEDIISHKRGLEFFFKKHNCRIEKFRDVHSKCLKHRDIILDFSLPNGEKHVAIVEGKCDWYNIRKDVNKENIVFEIIGSVSYDVVESIFSENEDVWSNSTRYSPDNIHYDKIHSKISFLMDNEDLWSKCSPGYFFSGHVPDNTFNLFSYYYKKYDTYFYIMGNSKKENINVRKMGGILKKWFKEKHPECFIHIAPNDNGNGKYLTINFLVPNRLIRETNCFLEQFKIGENE